MQNECFWVLCSLYIVTKHDQTPFQHRYHDILLSKYQSFRFFLPYPVCFLHNMPAEIFFGLAVPYRVI
jgi:hypothetical protein